MKATSQQLEAMISLITGNLNAMQHFVIDMFRNHALNYWECVIELDGEMIRTIHIDEMMGSSDTYQPKSAGELKLFPNGKTLAEMKSTPLELMKFKQTLII